MAEIPMGGQAMPAAEPKSIGTLVNWAGAAVSLGLVVGACVWGYQLMVRDVSGVPVVRAVEGPMRVQPDDPGGSQAAHQGLSVNTVAAEGTAGAPADRLVLAPPPIKLAEEDAVVTQVSLPGTAAAPTRNSNTSTQADIVAPPPITIGEDSDIDALAEQIAANVAPLSAPEPAPLKETKVEITAPVVKGGLGRSLRPQLRPADLANSVKVASATPVAPPSIKDVASDAVPAGTRMVQLGAYASSDIAKKEWDKLSAKFGDYLGDKTRVIQKATSGGRVFYRLRAMGFADVSDARRLCSALKAENADCIPVTSR
jgi:hypothetical protein